MNPEVPIADVLEMLETYHNNYPEENLKFGFLLDNNELNRIQSPAFKFDDSGLNVFDDFLPKMIESSLANDLEMLNKVVTDYKNELYSLATKLDWFKTESETIATDAVDALHPVKDK